MAGYIPESTKEVQAMIVKSYADTVLMFLLSPNSFRWRPRDERRISKINCRSWKNCKGAFVDRQRIAFACDIGHRKRDSFKVLEKKILKEEDIK